MPIPRFSIAAVALAFAASGFSAHANEIAQGLGSETRPGVDGPSAPADAPDESTRVTLGVGVGAVPDYEGSDDYEPIPLFNLRVQNLYDPNTFFQLRGLGFTTNLLPHPNFRLGISGQYAGERDDVEDNAVDDLRSTDDGFLLGVVAGYDVNISPRTTLGLEVDARYDVTDEVGGLITARAGFNSRLGAEQRWIVNGGVDSTYATSDYMENYFGIDQRDSLRSGLSSFDADAGIKDVGVSAGVTYRLTQHWSLTTIASYKRLVGDAEDSPVTDDAGSPNQFFGGALINYRF